MQLRKCFQYSYNLAINNNNYNKNNIPTNDNEISDFKLPLLQFNTLRYRYKQKKTFT